ncbi:MAG: AAA family ATPase, partial [Thermoleophilia bacterium]|nr:AAA family ATPase [Thermoleophilia bacterium]
PLNRRSAERLAQVVEAGGYRLVIIDTFSRLFQGDQNEASQVTAALAPLQEVALRLGVAILLLDHHNKPIQSDDSLDPVLAVLGSTAKGAVADAIWGLYRERGRMGAILAGTGRDLEDLRYTLRWDGLTKTWQLEDSDGLSESAREVLEAVADLGEATCKQVADAIGKDKGNTFRMLQDLVYSGRLTKKGTLYSVVAQPIQQIQPIQPAQPIQPGCNGCNGCIDCSQQPKGTLLGKHAEPAPPIPPAGGKSGIGGTSCTAPPAQSPGNGTEPEDPYSDIWAGVLG